jgi:Ca2+/H+ antiporter
MQRYYIYLVRAHYMGVHGVLLTAAVNVMTYVVGDGKSNWLEGAILICPCSSFLLFVVSQQPLIWVTMDRFLH